MKVLQDPLTGEDFIPKRNNQRFASRKNQVRFNNDLALKRKEYKCEILRQLENNWKALRNTLGNYSIIECSEEFLRGAGIHFGYITHSIMRNGNRWNCVFNYAYLKKDKECIKVIRL